MNNVFRDIIKSKCLLLEEVGRKDLSIPYQGYLAAIETGDANALERIEPVFHSCLADCCLKEGLSGYSSPEDEMALKDRLPDTIANWISALSALFSGEDESGRFINPDETAGVLLLRFVEWKTLNYEGTYLYGQEQETAVQRMFEALPHEMDMWGDMDEAWHIFVHSLEEMEPEVEEMTIHPAVRYLAAEGRLAGEEIGMAVRFVAFDRLRVRFGPEGGRLVPEIIDRFRSALRLGVAV